jgi:hypothetical protein
MTTADMKPTESGLGREKRSRIGRPKTRHEKLVPIATRCPTPVYVYLKGITPFQYPSLTAMFADMLARFMKEKPWLHGLQWRKPKTAISLAGNKMNATGWEQINISVTEDQAAAVEQTAAQCGVSKACFCYTAIFWWVTYVFPPASHKRTAS